MEKFQIEADVTPQFTKDETLNLRFPCKLWILINSPNSAASWGRNGRTVLLDYIALDRYLSSTLSIFRTETIFSFIRQLSCYGFQKVADGGASEVPPHGIFFEFENSNFVQQREDLLANVVVTSSQKKQLPKILQHSRTLRAQEDPCSSAIRALSAIEKARLNLRVILQMQAENYTLSKKLSNCEENSPSSAVSVIELPADAFENPFDSISRFEENSEYAGYYGNASTEQITQFFDEYLPIYAQANGDEITEKPASAQSRGRRGDHHCYRMQRRNGQ